MEQEVCISYAQAALSASNSWSAADYSNFRRPQKEVFAELASPLGDLVREVLRTSYTGKSLKQICATEGPVAAASSMELGAVR